MKFSQETLIAYADGELDAEMRRAIEDAMASDPEIAAQVERHRALRSKLGATFDGVLDEAIPKRLLDTAKSSPAGSGTVTDLATARAEGRKRSWSWPQWTSIAASLLIGVLAGRSVLHGSGTTGDSTLLATRGGGIVATDVLATALSEQVGGTQRSGTPIDVGLSFRDKSGAYCRTFSSQAIAGLACREADQWRVRALTQGEPEASGGNYRMAGTNLPPLLRQAVEATIEGEVLDAEEEAAARARGWR